MLDPACLDFIYYAMVGAFFTHELDAVKRHEWRILPLTSSFPKRLENRSSSGVMSRCLPCSFGVATEKR